MADYEYREMGERLQRCRIEHKVSQKEMAAACGVSKNYLSALERGVNKFSAITLIQYAKRLGMTVEALLGEDEGERILPELREALINLDDKHQRLVMEFVPAMEKW